VTLLRMEDEGKRVEWHWAIAGPPSTGDAPWATEEPEDEEPAEGEPAE
jgi:hypothetical protein